MAGKQAMRLIVEMGGKSGARCTGFLPPDLGALLAVDVFRLGFQDGDFRWPERFRQEKIALFMELLDLGVGQHGSFLLCLDLRRLGQICAVIRPAASAWRRAAISAAAGSPAWIAAQDRGMLLPPDAHRVAGRMQHRGHRAHQMRPQRRGHFGDRGIAGRRVQRAMEVGIGTHQIGDGRRAVERGTRLDLRRQLPQQRRWRCTGGDTLGGKTGGESVDCDADLIELLHSLGIDRHDAQALSADVLDQTLALQQMQRVADRLARNAQAVS